MTAAGKVRDGEELGSAINDLGARGPYPGLRPAELGVNVNY